MECFGNHAPKKNPKERAKFGFWIDIHFYFNVTITLDTRVHDDKLPKKKLNINLQP